MRINGRRVGDRMLAAAEYVAANPGCTKSEVSVWVGPHGSNAFGWRIVQRAIGAGLVNAGQHPRRSDAYALTVTNRGAWAVALS